MRQIVGIAALFFAFGIAVHAQEPVGALRGGTARVVLVGDSITGQSRNHPAGYAWQLDAAIAAVYPEGTPAVLALGGSGMGVNSWINVEQKSHTEERHLDVKDVLVKETLGQPADVVIVMLGMNDVLAPYVADTPEGIARWEALYAQLVAALRARLQPKVVGIATITMNTEDPNSAKNRFMDKLNARLAALAKREGCRLLPTAETCRRVLAEGRQLDPAFHVTADRVHPTAAGHLAIAIGMLRGLGEERAAAWLESERLAPLLAKVRGDHPGLSWAVTPNVAPAGPDRQTFQVRYWWPVIEGTATPTVTLAAPAGWEVTPAEVVGAAGVFTVTGAPGRLRTILSLDGTDKDEQRHANVAIPAPWLLAAKVPQNCWQGYDFEADRCTTAVDAAITAGEDFTPSLDWQRFFPSVDYTGDADPGSADFAAITHAANFEGGYGARWVYSDRDRPVKIELGSRIFAGHIHLTTRVNGQVVYAAQITSEPKRRATVDAALRQGWNALVFKASHRAWQWQVSVALAPVGDDSLDDLRYATTYHPAGSGQ